MQQEHRAQMHKRQCSVFWKKINHITVLNIHSRIWRKNWHVRKKRKKHIPVTLFVLRLSYSWRRTTLFSLGSVELETPASVKGLCDMSLLAETWSSGWQEKIWKQINSHNLYLTAMITTLINWQSNHNLMSS